MTYSGLLIKVSDISSGIRYLAEDTPTYHHHPSDLWLAVLRMTLMFSALELGEMLAFVITVVRGMIHILSDLLYFIADSTMGWRNDNMLTPPAQADTRGFMFQSTRLP